MHDGVNAESKRVVVDGRYGRGCRSADVRKHHLACGIAADRPEVGVVEGRLDGFVEDGV